MKFATADCETDPFLFGRVPEPFIWGFFDGNQFEYFFKTEDFVERISEFEGVIYAHNGGKFDWHFLFQYLKPQEKIMIINGRIAKMKIGNCELRDSYLLLPVPLRAYKKDDIDYSKLEKEKRFSHMAEIVEYLAGDVKYLYEILAVNFEEYGHKLTLASSAFDYWSKKFKEQKPSSNAAYFNFFKPYYYGGRVQCFQKGVIETPFKVFDINSAYPFAMIHEHPWSKEYHLSRKIPDNDDITKGFFHVRAISKGVFPFREKTGLSFPDDNQIRDYTITGWELKYALESGRAEIKNVVSARVFRNTKNFKPYVDHFYKMKAELKGKDEAKYLLSKLYLNSLYGKFGQSSEDHREYDLIPQDEICSYIEQDYEFETEIGKYALMSTGIDPKHMRFYNICVAASITGFVRAYMAKHIYSAKNPIYCDTDSIVCEDFTGEIGKDLGQWNHEGDFVKGAIGGKKLYALQYAGKDEFKISSKGARLNANEIFAIARGEEIEYKNDAPTFSIHKGPEFLTRKIRMT